jgi:hypothetical protein
LSGQELQLHFTSQGMRRLFWMTGGPRKLLHSALENQRLFFGISLGLESIDCSGFKVRCGMESDGFVSADHSPA